MKQDYQIWNVLHDGALIEIKGEIPGDLEIKVEIEYLSRKLKGGHDCINVMLRHCSLFEYERQWDKNTIHVYKNPEEIEGISPSLMALSCDEIDDYLLIYDICGSIKTRYNKAELTLENGEPLSFKELDHASKEYWENFGARHST